MVISMSFKCVASYRGYYLGGVVVEKYYLFKMEVDMINEKYKREAYNLGVWQNEYAGGSIRDCNGMMTNEYGAGGASNFDEYERFVRKYPEYVKTGYIDRLRLENYRSMDLGRHVYLDYTGAGVYGDKQVREHQKMLLSGIYGNPHSGNPTAMESTTLVEQSRKYVLDFFCADPKVYDVVFTSNASAAVRLVAESFPFTDGKLVLTVDNHNSLNGIREFAKQKGGKVAYVSLMGEEMRLNKEHMKKELARPSKSGHNLFAYPAQSNFSSVIHSLKWVSYAQKRGWYVLLDVAAYVPTNRLDLSEITPDFVVMSFYKMFGYPTGLGALIAKKTGLACLKRPWFAGGTIDIATVQTGKHILAKGHMGFEDGTINYLNIPAAHIGLRYIKHIGYEVIHERVRCLTSWLLENLLSFKHSTNQPLVKLYGPKTFKSRGGAVTVNFYDKSGLLIHHSIIEKKANKWNISIRTGCMCNPGAVEVGLNLPPKTLDKYYTLHKENKVNLYQPGVVRISVGLMSNFNDIQIFLKFCRKFLH